MIRSKDSKISMRIFFLAWICLFTAFSARQIQASGPNDVLFVFYHTKYDHPLLTAIKDVSKSLGYRTAQINAIGNDDTHGTKKSVDYGSGFFVSQTGLFITNYHVIEKAETIRLKMTDGNTIDAKVVVEDIDNDIAVLAPAKETRVPHWLALGSFTKESVGKKIKVLGYPFPQALKKPNMSLGIIVNDNGALGKRNGFQITAPIHLGNSGSPILDENNEVVGIVNEQLLGTSFLSETGPLPPDLNFGIKVNQAEPIMALLSTDAMALSIKKQVSLPDAEKATAIVLINTDDIVADLVLPEKGKLVFIEVMPMGVFALTYYTVVQLEQGAAAKSGPEIIQTGCIAGSPNTYTPKLAQIIIHEIRKKVTPGGYLAQVNPM